MIEGDDLEIFDRSLGYLTAGNTGPALDAALDEVGWHDALFSDQRAAISILFEHQGEENATSSALDQVLVHALGCAGDAVVLPPVGRCAAPGTVKTDRLRARGIGTSRLRRPGTVLVVGQVDTSEVAFEVDSESLRSRPVDGIDPFLELVDIDAEVAGVKQVGLVDWRNALSLGQLALAHEMVGACRRMLQFAREHALERVQFGRPIAKFQAVRYRLAETLVAIEAAVAMLDNAWLDRSPSNCAMAKATAGRCALVTARHCQQVMAGIGFTTEHPLHRYTKRVLALEQLLGSTRTLTIDLGNDVIERRQLPALLPL
ncbi:MAG TPA: acyl-CoA dehydrogenase family protein [Acidimicrobiales bacterium]|nr:acyl-CoA dehydrogenase family protein [Acidimicrobiales bacterium]